MSKDIIIHGIREVDDERSTPFACFCGLRFQSSEEFSEHIRQIRRT